MPVFDADIAVALARYNVEQQLQAQTRQIALVEVEGVVLTQTGPGIAVELDEGGRHGHRGGGGRGGHSLIVSHVLRTRRRDG